MGRAVSGIDETVAGSFRDPAGFVFRRNGTILRHVAESYGPVYDRLVASGLYQNLVRDGLLLPHEEVPVGPEDKNAHRILQPVEVPFVSYPYEWCFSQLRDSALVTLDIQIRAIEFQMSLKDASAYNIQLAGGRPVLVDSLSFEEYEEGYPWVAYKQFCQHFLAPLALMALRDVSLGRLLEIHLDGIPLELAARLLPLRSRLRPGLAMHLFSHARLQSRHAGAKMTREEFRGRMSRGGLLTILNNLRSTVRSLGWDPKVSAWSDYYQGESYDEAGFASKRRLVAEYLRSELAPKKPGTLEPTPVNSLESRPDKAFALYPSTAIRGRSKSAIGKLSAVETRRCIRSWLTFRTPVRLADGPIRNGRRSWTGDLRMQ